MRLTDVEHVEIVALARRRFGQHAIVRLFGSRTDDQRIGGDIDLHIQAERAELATLTNELEFADELKDRIGDQKIDVIVRRPNYNPRGIDELAVRTGIVL
jgi:predicted nucleotidyltransferase